MKKKKVDILVIGSGGRESAMIWKLLQSRRCGQIYFAPGNGSANASGGRVINVPIRATAINELLRFALEKKIGLTVVGPEDPLIAGIVDAFRRNNLRIFGPTAAAARLEGSKVWAKLFFRKYGIPTAPFEIFDDYGKALEFVKSLGESIVVKSDGPGLGKSAFVCQTVAEAEEALQTIMIKRAFGDSGNLVVVEKCLAGQEVSIQAVCAGDMFQPLLPSRDHKRIWDNDRGANTGGMGAYCPVPWLSEKTLDLIKETIIQPLLNGMVKEGCPYTGLLYPGLMLTEKGPMVLEVNCRFGDPETQVVLPLMGTDLLDVLGASVDNSLHHIRPEWLPGACVGVVMASKGYPEKSETGFVITGIKEAEANGKVTVFQAGTSWQDEKLVTSGGRVLCVTGRDETIEKAILRAYCGIDLVGFNGGQHRFDIGQSAIAADQQI